MHRIDRNDRVRLLALTWADSLPTAAVSNWEANVRSSEKLDRVVSAVIQRNEHGSHGDFEKAYAALPAFLRHGILETYHLGGPKSRSSERGIAMIAGMMPRYVRVPYEVMQNADVILRRLETTNTNAPSRMGRLIDRNRRDEHPEQEKTLLYFAERDGYIKIGISNNPKKRIVALRATLIGAMAGSRRLEQELKDRFVDLHEDVPFANHTEWFRDSPEIRRYIEENCTWQPREKAT